MASVSTGSLAAGSPRLLSLSTTLRKLLQTIDPVSLLSSAAHCPPACDFILEYLHKAIRGAAQNSLEKLMKAAQWAARRPDDAGRAGMARPAPLPREQVSMLVAWGLVPAMIALALQLLAAVTATHRRAPSSVGVPALVEALVTCIEVLHTCGGAALGSGAACPGVRAGYLLLAASGLPALLLEVSKLALKLYDDQLAQRGRRPLRDSSANPATAAATGSRDAVTLEFCLDAAAQLMLQLVRMLSVHREWSESAAFARHLLSDPRILEGLRQLPRANLACGRPPSDPAVSALMDAAAQLAAAMQAAAQSPVPVGVRSDGGSAGNNSLAAAAGYDVAMLRLEEGPRRGAGCGYPKCACFAGR